MALKKPIVINDTSGNLEELQAGDSIADPSPNTATFTAGENIGIRDAVYISADDTAKKALASAAGTMPAIGFAIETIASGNPVVVQLAGVVAGFSLLVANTEYYVSSTVAGAIVTSPPTGSGKLVERVGIAKSASELLINIGYAIKRG